MPKAPPRRSTRQRRAKQKAATALKKKQQQTKQAKKSNSKKKKTTSSSTNKLNNSKKTTYLKRPRRDTNRRGRKKKIAKGIAFKKCVHMSFDISQVHARVSKPTTWTCACDVSSDVWMCLTCGAVGCSRDKNKHALEHYEETKHPIAICLNTKHCWCFACDEWVTEDNQRSELDLIRSLLTDVQSQEFSASYTRSGKLIRSKQEAWNFKFARGMGAFVSFAVSAKQARKDKDFTAQFYYDRWIQVKCIEAWRRYVIAKKSGNNNYEQTTSPDSSPSPLLRLAVSGKSPSSSNNNRPSVLPLLDDERMSIDPRSGLSLKSPSPQSYRAREQKEAEDENNKNAKTPKRALSKRKRKKVLLPGRVGMTNLGNTCYINSVFQALSHTKKFWKYFIKFRIENFGHNDSSSNSSSSTENDSSGNDDDDDDDGFSLLDIKGSSSSNKHIPQLRRQTSEELYEHAKSKENKKKGTAVSLCYEIHSLLRVLWSGKWGVVTPNNLVFGIWRFIPWFRSYRQQDAHEFFNCFIDRVNTELLQESKKHTNLAKKFKENNPRINLNISTKYVEHQHVAKRTFEFAKKTFIGSTRQKVTCSVCKNVSVTDMEFPSLQVNIPLHLQKKQQWQRKKGGKRGSRKGKRGNNKEDDDGNKTKIEDCKLEDCIRHLIREEKLEGDAKYACDHCKCHQVATKQVKINALPQILVININRARWDLRGTRHKIKDHVEFPLKNLDLSYACWDDDDIEEEKVLYNLSSIVSHHGGGLDKGHYSALCLDAGDRNTWMHFNDRRWSIEEPEEVESSQAYLLFYEINTNLSSNEIEEYTQQVAKPNRSSDIANIAFV